MSSHSDPSDRDSVEIEHSYRVVDQMIEEKILSRMQPQPLDYLFNRNKWIILFIFFIVILIYYQTFSLFFHMMKNVHSKHQYFDENLKKEREKINTLKKVLIQMKEDVQKNINATDSVCHKYWYSFSKLDYRYITSIVLEHNKHIKKSYDTLFPLQYSIILISFLHIFSITIIFKKPTQLLLLSNLFSIISLCLHGKHFIAETPNTDYTLIVGAGIFLFSVYVLLKILNTMLTIIEYRSIKDILRND